MGAVCHRSEWRCSRNGESVREELLLSLREIGWSHVQQIAPNQARRLLHSLIAAAVEPTPLIDKSQAQALLAIKNSAARCLKDLEKISAQTEGSIDIHCTPVELLDTGATKAVGDARQALMQLIEGTKHVHGFMSNSAAQIGRGNPINYRAHFVAKAVAEAFVIGLGQAPKFGMRPDGAGPSTLFGRTVVKCLHVLEIDASEKTSGHLKAAIENVSEPDTFKQLMAYHTGAGRLEGFSLFYYMADRE